MYREAMPRATLWVFNAPFGVGPRIEYWENMTGWQAPGWFENIKLKN